MAETYFGKLCAKHPELDGERIKSTGHCPSCKKEWRTRNAERIREYHRSWTASNPEKTKEYSRVQRTRRAANIEEIRGKDRQRHAARYQTPEYKEQKKKYKEKYYATETARHPLENPPCKSQDFS